MDDFSTNRRGLFGAAALVAGAGLVAGNPAGAAGSSGWQASPESIDAWMDKPGTRHRMVFDGPSASGGWSSVGYATNFYYANDKGYGLKPEQLGVIIVLRHESTVFGYDDTIWKKYGRKFAANLKLKGDDLRHATAGRNPMLVVPKGPVEKGMEWNAGAPLVRLAGQGARFAVCGLATEGIAHMLAGKGGDWKAVEADLKAHVVPGAIVVPAGIVAVNRAQEHGYAFAFMD